MTMLCQIFVDARLVYVHASLIIDTQHLKSLQPNSHNDNGTSDKVYQVSYQQVHLLQMLCTNLDLFARTYRATSHACYVVC